MDPRIQITINLMKKDIARNISLNTLANSVNLSTSRYRHLFKNEMGMGPAQYLQIIRMEQAKFLLETTFMRVKEIALLLGLSCDASLARSFKVFYGLAPVEYRRQYLNSFATKAASKPTQPDSAVNSLIG